MQGGMDTSQVDLPALTKGLSLCTGALVVICSIVYMAAHSNYVSVVVGLETIVFASILLVLEVQAPDGVIEKIRSQLPGLLSVQGQLFLSVLTALFLFAMDAFGIAMAVILLAVVALNAYVLTNYPDSMPVRFGTLEPTDATGEQFAQPPYAAYPDGANYEYNPAAAKQPPQPSTADL